MKIDRISIKGFQTVHKPDTHVLYLIEFTTKTSTWTTKRRFSEFFDLHAKLSKKFTIKEQLPPKKMFGSLSPDVIEHRRAVFERFLKEITQSDNPELSENKLVFDFLEFDPNLKQYETIDENNWIEQYQDTEAFLVDVSTHVTNYERSLQYGEGNPEELLQAKKKIVQFTTKLNSLADALSSNQSNKITEKEVLRRRDLLSKLRIQKEDIERRIKNPRQNTGTRNELMRGNDDTGGSSRNPRVFGTKPVETEKTINLDDEGLLQLQKDEMKQHDEQLEQLLSVLKRQAQIGAAIGEELDSQNKLLDELETDVDRTRSKLKKTGKTLIKVSANA